MSANFLLAIKPQWLGGRNNKSFYDSFAGVCRIQFKASIESVGPTLDTWSLELRLSY